VVAFDAGVLVRIAGPAGSDGARALDARVGAISTERPVRARIGSQRRERHGRFDMIVGEERERDDA
jgi:hypothetical protein